LIAQTVSKTKDVNDAIIKQVSLFSEKLNAGSISKDDLINLMSRCEEFQEKLPTAKTPANET